MKRQRRWLALFAILVVFIFISAPVFAAWTSASTVDNALDEYTGINFPPAHQTWYSDGRHWVIYPEYEALGNADTVYTSTTNGLAWTDGTIATGDSNGAENVASWYDSASDTVHYARIDPQSTLPDFGGALSFDGGDYATADDDDTLSFGDSSDDSPFSIEAWVYVDVGALTPSGRDICAKRDPSANWEYYLAIDAVGDEHNFHFTLYDEIATVFAFCTTSGEYDVDEHEGEWIYVAATYDGTGSSDAASGMTIYVNGIDETGYRETSVTYDSMHNQGGLFRMGICNCWGNWLGDMDSIRVSNVERQLAEIQTTFASDTMRLYEDHATVALWQMDEGSGDTLYDDTDLDNDATKVGPTWITGFVMDADWGLSFVDGGAGAGGAVVIADDPTLSFGNGTTDQPFSVEAWIKPEMLAGVTTDKDIVTKYRGVGGKEWSFHWDENGALCVLIYDGDLAHSFTAFTNTLHDDVEGDWTYVAFTYDGTGSVNFENSIEIYVNGEPDVAGGSHEPAGYIAMDDSDEPVRIGFGYAHGPNYGDFDEVRISNYVRSADEIEANYNDYEGRHFLLDSNTVGLWRFDENTGITAYDETTNDNDGTLTAISGGALPTWVDGIIGDGPGYADRVMYRMGTPESNGTITWAAVEQSVAILTNELYITPTMVNICCDEDGYPWIIFIDDNGGDPNKYPVVISSSTKNGTWTQDVYKDNFLQWDDDQYASYVSIMPLAASGDIIHAAWSEEDISGGLHDGEVTLEADVYNDGTGWDDNETVVAQGSMHAAYQYAFSFYDMGANMWVAYTDDGGDVLVRQRTSAQTWGTAGAATAIKEEGLFHIPTLSGYQANGAGEDIICIINDTEGLLYATRDYDTSTWSSWTVDWSTALGADDIRRHVASYKYASPMDYAWQVYIDASGDDELYHDWISPPAAPTGGDPGQQILEIMLPLVIAVGIVLAGIGLWKGNMVVAITGIAIGLVGFVMVQAMLQAIP